MPDDLALLKAKAAPAAVGITDHAFGIGDQNQALGMTENFAGEIPLFLQLGLRLAEDADIEHEAAVLHDLAGGIAQGMAVHEDVNRGAVLAPQDLFVIAHFAGLFSGV